jgi:hypothetical protein
MTQDYGDDVVVLIKDLVKEQLTEYVGKEVSPKLKAHGERVDNIETTTGRTAFEIFTGNVTAQVSDWKQINGWKDDGIPQDPKWTAFMSEPAPGTGKTYNELLGEHWTNHNVSSTVEIFNLYKNKYKPAGDITPSGAPNANDHIEPDNSGGGGAPKEDPKKKTYSKEVVDAFYNDIGKGRFSGTQKEKEELDIEYNTALVEGRVL